MADRELSEQINENEDISEVKARIVARSKRNKGETNEGEGKIIKHNINPSEDVTSEAMASVNEDRRQEDGNEFLVLDPDHPQMQKFQKSLKDLLEKKSNELSIEIKELIELTKRKRTEREEIGIQLYHNQNELLKQQTNLQKQNEFLEGKSSEKQNNEMEFKLLKQTMDNKMSLLNKEKLKLSELQTELDSLNVRVFYLEHAKENISGDVAAIKRAAIKSDVEMKKAEELKQHQDLFVESLTRKVIKLSEELTGLKKQLSDQMEETRLAKEAMHESQMELEILNSEKKKLIQNWNSSLIAVRKREEATVVLIQDLNKLEEDTQMLTKDKEGIKHLIEKEQEKNEAFQSMISRIDFDIQRVDKQTDQLKKEIEEYQDKNIRLNKILQETESSFTKIANEKSQQENILNQLRKDIEKLHKEKIEIEDRMMEKVHQQISLKTATKYTNKVIHKIRDMTKELDYQIANTENEMSKKSMEETHVQIENNYLEKMLKEYNVEVQDKHNLITKSETAINQRNIQIERKQNQIDILTKKIDTIKSETGVKDTTPMELQIKSIQRTITSTQDEIQQIEQLWLRDQAELVKLVNLKSKEEESMENYKNEIIVFTQKLMRVEGQLSRQNKELQSIEKSINDMKHDTVKLNTLISKEKGNGDVLVQNQKLSIREFEASLKQAEKEVIEMHEKFESMKEDKEYLLNSLLEAEKQILLWKKKIQLAQETRESVDGDLQNEIKVARNEVHRMEVRLQQLERDCEKRCQDMEKLVANREANMVRSEAMKSRTHLIAENAIKREATAMKRKITEKFREAEEYNLHLKNLSEDHRNLCDAITSEQTNLKQISGASALLESEIENISEEKQRAFIDTVIGQNRMKCYQQLKENKYKKSAKSLQGEHKRQLENMKVTLSILNNLMLEYPEAEKMLKKAALIYRSRVA